MTEPQVRGTDRNEAAAWRRYNSLFDQTGGDFPTFNQFAVIEEAARAEGRRETRDAMRTRIGTADPHFPQAIRLRLYTLIDEVAVVPPAPGPGEEDEDE